MTLRWPQVDRKRTCALIASGNLFRSFKLKNQKISCLKNHGFLCDSTHIHRSSRQEGSVLVIDRVNTPHAWRTQLLCSSVHHMDPATTRAGSISHVTSVENCDRLLLCAVCTVRILHHTPRVYFRPHTRIMPPRQSEDMRTGWTETSYMRQAAAPECQQTNTTTTTTTTCSSRLKRLDIEDGCQKMYIIYNICITTTRAPLHTQQHYIHMYIPSEYGAQKMCHVRVCGVCKLISI